MRTFVGKGNNVRANSSLATTHKNDVLETPSVKNVLRCSAIKEPSTTFFDEPRSLNASFDQNFSEK